MLEVAAALQQVLAAAHPLPPQQVPASAALDLVLAENVTSDLDSPPHDKSIVDGYAVLADDVSAAGVELTVIEEVTAGAMPTRRVERGTATRIMTGAPVPEGADAVVMVEQTRLVNERVAVFQSPVERGQNIARRASSLARGQTVLSAGQRIRAIELGLLAEVGRSNIGVVPRPSVAIVATGNELVPPAAVPGPAQIRNSNESLLDGLVKQAGGVPTPLGIARDDADDLRDHIDRGLAHDVLVLSGGVSAGVLDLVPAELTRQGVRQIFHKVNLKPGKPLWFGVKQSSPSRQTLVFGLPGNPVSTLVCFELFVRPAIERLRGLPGAGLPWTTATLTIDHQQRGERPTYWPAKLENGLQRVTPLPWKGSGDLRTLTDADCLAYFPGGDHTFEAGQAIAVLLLTSDR